MIRTESLLYKLDLRLNKLATNDHQQIPVENKILVLREAIITLVKRKMDDNNVLKQGYDANKKRYQDLQSITEKAEDHPIDLYILDENINKWGAEMVGLRPRPMFVIGGYILADKGECKDRVIVFDVEMAKHADLTLLLTNADYIPSFEYQETISTITGNVFEVYTDGTFTPKQAYISYIRYPKEIDYKGYEKFDGSSSQIVDSELPHYLEGEILDIATESLGYYTENIVAIQGANASDAKNE